MSRARRGHTDPIVAKLADDVTRDPDLRRIIQRAVTTNPAAASDPAVYSAAAAMELDHGLRELARWWLTDAERSTKAGSPRRRISELVGISRQSLESTLGLTRAARSRSDPPGVP